MKKILALLLVIVLGSLFLMSCESNDSHGEKTYTEYSSSDSSNNEFSDDEVYIEHSGYESAVKFMQYNWEHWGVSTKMISTCDVAYAIIDELDKMKETGEIIPKISDQAVDASVGELPVKTGTIWLEVGSKIYRIDRDPRKISRVDGHLGQGYVLDAPDSFFTLVYNAWQYHPYDFYIGSYDRASDKLDIKQVYKGTTTISVQVKDIEIGEGFDADGTAELVLVSSVDQTARIHLHSQQSEDNFASMKFVDVTFEAGKAEAVEIEFGTWSNWSYYLTVFADNTRVEITVNP